MTDNLSAASLADPPTHSRFHLVNCDDIVIVIGPNDHTTAEKAQAESELLPKGFVPMDGGRASRRPGEVAYYYCRGRRANN